MSRVFIKNGYCCGHGEIIHRLINYCISNNIEYEVEHVDGKSFATHLGKSIELKPNLSLSSVVSELQLS